MSGTLRFGIPSLDELCFAGENPQDQKGELDHSTNMAIVGPDGTGKSVLAMHLASNYMAQCLRANRPAPIVLYISTDLKYHRARAMWRNFALDRPSTREIPFEPLDSKRDRKLADPQVSLCRTGPCEADEDGPCVLAGPLRTVGGAVSLIEQLVSTQDDHVHVAFLDLASRTEGDDWAYVTRLIHLISRREGAPPNLAVIDSVAGFETLVGDLDTHGVSLSRRSRIAQLLRSARNDWQLAFVVEEPKEAEHYPEEYVTDMVVRLRRTLNKGAARLTLEIEKARTISHALGQHYYEIRDREGTTTGTFQNPDDPNTKNSYVQVFPSLLHVNQKIIRRRVGPLPAADPTQAAFGIPFCDDMLVPHKEKPGEAGLPAGSFTALIGDEGTHKTALGMAFILNAFRIQAASFQLLALALRTGDLKEASELLNEIHPSLSEAVPTQAGGEEFPHWFGRVISEIHKADGVPMMDTPLAERDEKAKLHLRFYDHACRTRVETPAQAASWLLRHPKLMRPVVLLTTHDVRTEEWATKFAGKLLKENADRSVREEFEKHILESWICRRMEIQDLPTSTIFHMIYRSVEQAQRMLYYPSDRDLTLDERSDGKWDDKDIASRREFSGHIRVVIDDFRILRETHPDIKSDPLFLPLLQFVLGREGVTTLVIDTAAGRPGIDPRDPVNLKLRSLAQHVLYTWRVEFDGQNRVAIAAIPAMSPERSGLIRELKTRKDELVTVDPDLELYSQVEQGRPELVPLQIRLYEETGAMQSYVSQELSVLEMMFRGVDGGPVVHVEPPDAYDRLKDLASMPSEARLGHSLIVQVDGFWALKHDGNLRSQEQYLKDHLPGELHELELADPLRVYRKHKADPLRVYRKPKKDSPSRLDFFGNSGYQTRIQVDKRDSDDQEAVDRVPFVWDFGFLVCDRSMWERAAKKEISLIREDKRKDATVGDVWNALTTVRSRSVGTNTGLSSWRAFLEACKAVAEVESLKAGEPVTPLEVAGVSGESLACLFLEVWFSEIYRSGNLPPSFLEQLAPTKYNVPAKDSFGLVELLRSPAGLLHDFEGIKKQAERKSSGEVNIEPQIDSRCWELYKTWLLLVDVLDLNSYVDASQPFHLRHTRKPGLAAATRHWYKTACKMSDVMQASDQYELVRLPGNFSVRGDWFLAAAKGSRSGRLVDRALDIMCSRRSNVRRLQDGVGLPVRDVLEDEAMGKIRTRLPRPRVESADDSRIFLTYEELCRLGGDSFEANREQPEQFYWLWRSGLKGYDRHSVMWNKWLNHLLSWSLRYRHDHGAEWFGGFKPYDWMSETKGDADKPGNLPYVAKNFASFRAFADLCDQLVAILDAGESRE